MSDSKRYVLHPGDVISRTDGDRHYIGAKQLARLYGVPMAECLVWSSDPRMGAWGAPEGMIHLYPRYDGNYTLEAPADEPLSGPPRGPIRDALIDAISKKIDDDAGIKP